MSERLAAGLIEKPKPIWKLSALQTQQVRLEFYDQGEKQHQKNKVTIGNKIRR